MSPSLPWYLISTKKKGSVEHEGSELLPSFQPYKLDCHGSVDAGQRDGCQKQRTSLLTVPQAA